MKGGVVICLAGLALVVAACGGSDEATTPIACRSGSGPYLSALRDAPDGVALEGSTPISECLVEGQEAGDLGDVGEAMVAGATELNKRARRERGARSALELGYLVGAAERGAERTGGIHTDLVRRLSTAARFAPSGDSLGRDFDRAYARGRAAGTASG